MLTNCILISSQRVIDLAVTQWHTHLCAYVEPKAEHLEHKLNPHLEVHYVVVVAYKTLLLLQDISAKFYQFLSIFFPKKYITKNKKIQ